MKAPPRPRYREKYESIWQREQYGTGRSAGPDFSIPPPRPARESRSGIRLRFRIRNERRHKGLGADEPMITARIR
ncbi:hypothetical protein [Nocardia vermiculata]|uniref:Uncharacterized protein n=1 Tax=Nocardia vermiculata TaxID=257274 RepID=A0A846Y1L3_9NOCA|nr:hypothetical protein [Nocardia vermiculata]NKY52737.1 hypothetical protein [Nocardia vermiculata]